MHGIFTFHVKLPRSRAGGKCLKCLFRNRLLYMNIYAATSMRMFSPQIAHGGPRTALKIPWGRARR